MMESGVELLDSEWSLEPSAWWGVGGVMVTVWGEPLSGSSQFELNSLHLGIDVTCVS